MVEMINSFRALHERGLIHGDIRREVIVMKDSDSSDMRIANFGSGEVKSDGYLIAMRRLMDPECFTVQAGIYSLAMTLASLEGGLLENMKRVDINCFTRQTSAECDE